MSSKVEKGYRGDLALPVRWGLKSEEASSKMQESDEHRAIQGVIFAHGQHGVACENSVYQVPADKSDVRRVNRHS